MMSLQSWKRILIDYICLNAFISIVGCIEIPLSQMDDLFQFGRNHDKPSDHYYSKDRLSGLSPVVDVQSVLSDGIGWEGSMGFETAYQVVITISGSDPETGSFIPFADIPVTVKLDGGDLRCIVEDGNGNGQFTKCDLSSEPFVFKTNILGRISFSLPVPGIYKDQELLSALPALLIRTDFMSESSWIAAHIDDDAHYKLSRIDAATVIKANPRLSFKSAKEISLAISYIFKASLEQFPYQRLDSRLKLLKRDHDYQHASIVGNRSLQYNAKYNRLSTYQIQEINGSASTSSSGRLLFRKFGYKKTQSLEKRSIKRPQLSDWFDECRALLRRDNGTDHDAVAGDDVHSWSLWTSKVGTKMAFFRDSVGKISSVVIEKVSDVWNFLNLLLLQARIRIEEIMDSLRSFFDFTDILNTQRFLSSYYLLLAPLGFRGLDITEAKYRELYMKFTTYATNLTDWAFGLNTTIGEYEKWSYKFIQGPNMDGVVFPPYVEPKHQDLIPKEIPKNILHSSDGLTHSILDRIVNNIQHIKIVDPAKNFNTSAFSRLNILVQEAISIILKKVPVSAIENLLPHLLEFGKGSAYDMTLGFFLKGIQKLIMSGSQTFFLLLDSLSHLLPIYWNLVTFLITVPIKIPFVYEWFTKRFSRGSTDLTLTDLLTLFGGTAATWTYKLYNENYAPYTSTDIEVLRSNTEPELILYTWGHDPRTNDVNDTVSHIHRLGIYDWIPKMHQLVLSTFTSLSIDIPTYLFAHDPRSPPQIVTKAQSFNVLVGIMQRAGYYPFTQLDTNDPEKIAHSKKNPDKRFLEVWLINVFGDFFKMIQPALPQTFNHYPIPQLFNLFTVTIPNLAFGLKLQIASVRQVNKLTDLPKKMVVHLQWVNQLMGWISPFLVFCKDTSVYLFNYKITSPFIISGPQLRKIQYFRNGVSNAITLIRNHITMSNHIVGLMSSSYQGKSMDGGKRREVIDRESRLRSRLS